MVIKLKPRLATKTSAKVDFTVVIDEVLTVVDCCIFPPVMKNEIKVEDIWPMIINISINNRRVIALRNNFVT